MTIKLGAPPVAATSPQLTKLSYKPSAGGNCDGAGLLIDASTVGLFGIPFGVTPPIGCMSLDYV